MMNRLTSSFKAALIVVTLLIYILTVCINAFFGLPGIGEKRVILYFYNASLMEQAFFYSFVCATLLWAIGKVVGMANE